MRDIIHDFDMDKSYLAIPSHGINLVESRESPLSSNHPSLPAE